MSIASAVFFYFLQSRAIGSFLMPETEVRIVAASRIKGITVEIDGDTTGLSKALSSVNKEMKSTQSQLKDVKKLLKLDPTNTELLEQKQKLLNEAVSETKEKLETLKTAAEQANTALANSDIVKGSGYISSQCCGSTEIELGTVYSSELGITLYSDVDRYTLENAIIEISCFLLLPDGSYEEVPMGVFEVSEANRTVNCLEIKAYDYMLRFEKDFNGFQSTGTAYDFIYLCCLACSVEMAQTQEEIESMANGSETLSI